MENTYMHGTVHMCEISKETRFSTENVYSSTADKGQKPLVK